MTIRDLLNEIDEYLINDTLTLDSKVTVHVYVGNWETIEYSDVFTEYNGESDGLEINVK